MLRRQEHHRRRRAEISRVFATNLMHIALINLVCHSPHAQIITSSSGARASFRRRAARASANCLFDPVRTRTQRSKVEHFLRTARFRNHFYVWQFSSSGPRDKANSSSTDVRFPACVLAPYLVGCSRHTNSLNQIVSCSHVCDAAQLEPDKSV